MTELIDAPQAVKPINHWIGGKRREGGSGRRGPVFDPATGAQTGAVDFASPEEIDAAVQAAKAAFPAWRALSLSRRAELFFRIRELEQLAVHCRCRRLVLVPPGLVELVVHLRNASVAGERPASGASAVCARPPAAFATRRSDTLRRTHEEEK